MKKKIVISGAGLAGTLLAVACAKRGHDVHLFEKRSDMRAEDQLAGKSINLILTAKGIKPLSDLGVLEDVLTITTPVFGRIMHSTEGELTYQPYGRDESEKNYSISRAGLNIKLLDLANLAGVHIHFDSELIQIDPIAKKAQFKLLELDYDVFFGADGAGSKTRELMSEFSETTYNVTPLGSSYKELLMPALPDGSYAIDEKALHIWPRGNHMLMALPNQGGSFTMTLYMPDDWFDKFNSKESVKEYFEEYYLDATKLMPNYLEEYFENPKGFLGSLNCENWTYDDSICLIGDAAHAIVPFFGQGMNCSFSDVNYLIEKMDQNLSFREIFIKYKVHQKLNGDAIRDMSLENFHEMSDSVGDEKFLFRKKVEQILEKKFPELYRSRYARVVYTLMPYHEAKRLGEIQKEIITELVGEIKTPEAVDLVLAKKLIETKLGC